MTLTPSTTPSTPRPHAFTATVATPDGPFTLVTSDEAVLASGWTEDVTALCTLVHPTLRPSPDEVVPVGVRNRDGALGGDAATVDAPTILATALAAVTAYYEGDLTAPQGVPVHQSSGPFRVHAWNVLREVTPGRPVTYAEFAARAGRPRAVRAAAGACALNAAALFVPCHRVVRTDGSLGGFHYGLPLKERLLARETTELQ